MSKLSTAPLPTSNYSLQDRREAAQAAQRYRAVRNSRPLNSTCSTRPLLTLFSHSFLFVVGKIKYHDEEYEVNLNFQQLALQLADFLEIDEVEAARILIDSEADQTTLSRPLIECGVIRFHQRRKYLLDCARLLINLSRDDEIEGEMQEFFITYVSENIFCQSLGLQGQAPGKDRITTKCLDGIRDIRTTLQKLSERITGQSVVSGGPSPGFQETTEYSRVALIEQHELLCIILSMAVEKQQAQHEDFQDYLGILQKTDKYDNLLAHLFPALGAFISLFNSPESSSADIQTAKKLNAQLSKAQDNEPWLLPYLAAAVKGWWITEYSGWYLEDSTPGELTKQTRDQEEALINEKFLESLKEGALDLLLSIVADVKPLEWQDPARNGIRQWLQRKAPSILTDSVPFSDDFQTCLISQFELFVDSFITNMPDMLRKLRVEEDEQRQLSHDHEQELNLERFLMIVAYTYDGRADAGAAFWDDPESNLAGFMQWASRRASTPLVITFCEALQSVSDNEECASAAHQFLNEKSQPSSGRMRQSLSLTWTQIFKELVYFSSKIRERPSVPQSQVYRGAKAPHEPAETEPESAMMLESYLRLVTKLASKSFEAREFLLKSPEFNLVEVLYQLAAGSIPPRLRACTFNALRALMTDKSREDGDLMWTFLDSWMTAGFQSSKTTQRPGGQPHQHPIAIMESIFDELGNGFEEPNAFIQFLASLVAPPQPFEPMNDALPFPEDLGAANRQPGVEFYVDFVLGHVFGIKSSELQDVTQLRMLRLSCLEFALTCLSTFNESLIVLGSETSINVDRAISASDLSTYIRLHPFARVMEWMFNDKVFSALMNTIQQDPKDIGKAAPNSPLVLGILRGVEIVSKVLELQATYLDLVRKHIKLYSSGSQRQEVSNISYGGLEDGLLNHLSLVIDLGRYCGLGLADLTLACLKLLEKMSISSRIINAWNPATGHVSYRNKAIVALEANEDGDAIAGSLIDELTKPLDQAREAESSNYQIKIYILDFLYACIRATPSQPTIAHLLLGFKCEPGSLSVEPNGSFDQKTSLFHNLLRVLLETPFGDDTQVRYWLVNLKYKTMRVLQALWTSPLSFSIVMAELRENDILFHLLLRELLIEPELPWEGQLPTGPEFLLEPSGATFVNFLSTRAMMLEYVSRELCGVTKDKLPGLKRKVFEALNGQVRDNSDDPIDIPTIFDLFDFLQDGPWQVPEPQFHHCSDINTAMLMDHDAEGNIIFSPDKAKEVLHLKQGELRSSSQLVKPEDIAKVEEEESLFLTYIVYLNRRRQHESARLRVLKSWTNLMLVMIESSDFKGATRVLFMLRVLQAIIPGLEQYGSEAAEEAYHLAKVAKILLYSTVFTSSDRRASDGTNGHGVRSTDEREQRSLGTLISDKLHQLFQICLQSLCKRVGTGKLRSIYYAICYRHLTATIDRASETSSSTSSFLPGGGAKKALLSVHSYGERLLEVICDDADGSDMDVQAAAVTLLRTFVTTGTALGDHTIIEILNRLNFIGVMVDSLRDIMTEWMSVISPKGVAATAASPPSHPITISHMHAKLALLLSAAQTRGGAKHMLHANLLRTIDQSGLFSADPELQLHRGDFEMLALHYGLVSRVARIITAAIMSRGEHNVLQGQTFLKTHRTLVLHVLKRSVGIGMPEDMLLQGVGNKKNDGDGMMRVIEEVDDLAEAFMLLIAATGFLEVSFLKLLLLFAFSCYLVFLPCYFPSFKYS